MSKIYTETYRMNKAADGSHEQSIFDVGMSEGNDSDFYLHKGFKVVGVEADVTIYNGLRDRFRQEVGSGRLTIYNRAAGATDVERLTFFHHNVHQGLSGLSNARSEFSEGNFTTSVVLTISWLALIQRHGVPYYLKIDIEGAEMPFLKGMTDQGPFPQYVSVECHTIQPVAVLYGLGYRHFKLIDQNPPGGFVLPLQQVEGNIIEWVDWTHSSGPFGRELPGDRWLTFEEFNAAWDGSQSQCYRTWFDCHAWMPPSSSELD